MKTVNLERIIEQNNLSPHEVAAELFPTNRYPKRALDRVLAEEGHLDAPQLSRLAALLGVEVQDLFTGSQWKATSTPGLMVFTHEDYRAEVDTEKWMTKVFAKGSLFHEDAIHTRTITLSELLMDLDNIIKKHESDD